jgi:DNA-binding MarR family transcriptional regulator
MARKRKQGEESAFSKLTPAQQRAWLAFIRLRLRLTYEMNRQLQAEANLSLADYDVLNALRYEPEGRTQITALAIRIGWERSRLSHHLRRLEGRELVELRTAPTDGRATEITLTDQGWAEITQASTGHVELIQRLFFDALPDELVEPMTVALESIYDNVIERGTLPRPAHESS